MQRISRVPALVMILLLPTSTFAEVGTRAENSKPTFEISSTLKWIINAVAFAGIAVLACKGCQRQKSDSPVIPRRRPQGAHKHRRSTAPLLGFVDSSSATLPLLPAAQMLTRSFPLELISGEVESILVSASTRDMADQECVTFSQRDGVELRILRGARTVELLDSEGTIYSAQLPDGTSVDEFLAIIKSDDLAVTDPSLGEFLKTLEASSAKVLPK